MNRALELCFKETLFFGYTFNQKFSFASFYIIPYYFKQCIHLIYTYMCIWFFLSNHKYLCRLSLFSLKIIQKMNSSEAPRLIDCKLDSIFHSFPREISLGHMYLSTWSVNMTTPPPPSTHIFCGIYLGYAWILSITFLSNWCNHLTLS